MLRKSCLAPGLAASQARMQTMAEFAFYVCITDVAQFTRPRRLHRRLKFSLIQVLINRR